MTHQNGTSQYFKNLLFAAGLVFLGHLFGMFFIKAPGLGIGLLEITIELFAAFFIVSSSKFSNSLTSLQKTLFTGFFLFCAFSDTSYIWFYYVKQIGVPNFLSTITAELGSTIAFLSLTLYLLRSSKREGIKFFLQPITLFPILVLTPITIRLGSPLFLRNDLPYTATIIGLDAFALCASYLLFVTAITTFLSSSEPFWTSLSTGIISFLLADWSIKVEKFLGHKVSFEIYEYMWAFGIFMAAFSVLLRSNSLSKIEAFNNRSIALSSKLFSILIAFTTVFIIDIYFPEDVNLVKLVTCSTIFGVIAASVLSHLHVDRLSDFSNKLLNLVTSKLSISSPDSLNLLPTELSEVFQSTLDDKLSFIEEEKKRYLETQTALRKSEIAAQVAHDIKSPVFALKVLASDFHNLSSNTRSTIEQISSRITKIADDLLKPSNSKENGNEYFLEEVIDEIVSEKKLQYSHRPGLAFKMNVETTSRMLRVDYEPGSLKRVISNLLNNAAEAIPSNGNVVVQMFVGDTQTKINVIDDGAGIPKERLPLLGLKGSSFGKPDGQGLGLYSAKNWAESLGGSLEIESEINKGTKISITLPVLENIYVG